MGIAFELEVLMTTSAKTLEALATRDYKWGFVSDIEADTLPPGLNEDVIRQISAKKAEPEFMLQWRLRAYRHWSKLERAAGEPKWANVTYPPIDYQKIVYYSAPKRQGEGPADLGGVGDVRAHLDRRRARQLRQLPRGLHGADARREPATRGGRRAGRARGRADQVFDRAELVCRRQRGPRRHLQLRHQARQVRGPCRPYLVDPGGDRL